MGWTKESILGGNNQTKGDRKGGGVRDFKHPQSFWLEEICAQRDFATIGKRHDDFPMWRSVLKQKNLVSRCMECKANIGTFQWKGR